MKASRRIRCGRAWLLSIAGLGALPGVAVAADGSAEPSAIESRWIPSASFYSFGQVDQRTATMIADTPVKQGETSLDKEGQSFGLPWSIGGTLDVASPVVLDAPGRPRFFAHADVGFTYDLEDPVVTEGDPGSQPLLPPNATNSIAIQNVGASVRAEAKPLVLSGGLGSVFSFEAYERGIRVRPTLEWMYRRDTIKNALGGGESEAATGTSCIPAGCRTLFIKTQNEKGFHSLGPGLEVEADIGRSGELLFGLYGSFRAFYVVSDRKANIRSSGSWERTDGQPTTRPDTVLTTQYEREPWHYRFGMGIRVLWSPEE